MGEGNLEHLDAVAWQHVDDAGPQDGFFEQIHQLMLVVVRLH